MVDRKERWRCWNNFLPSVNMHMHAYIICLLNLFFYLTPSSLSLSPLHSLQHSSPPLDQLYVPPFFHLSLCIPSQFVPSALPSTFVPSTGSTLHHHFYIKVHLLSSVPSTQSTSMHPPSPVQHSLQHLPLYLTNINTPWPLTTLAWLRLCISHFWPRLHISHTLDIDSRSVQSWTCIINQTSLDNSSA